jgi:hypothetical protein
MVRKQQPRPIALTLEFLTQARDQVPTKEEALKRQEAWGVLPPH